MASILQIENLTKSYGDRILFADVTFGMEEGDKTGIVARNGTGKSTLLRIICGQESPDSGSVTWRLGTKVGFLEQTPDFGTAATIREAAMQHAAASVELELECERLLTQLMLPEYDAPLAGLSGGQRKRVALVRTLLQHPDMVVLDEPTNHLDIEVIEWLEEYLRRSRLTLLMVTHDRYFLDRVCSRILELDDCTAYAYDGNYDYFLRRREERIEAMAADAARARNLLRKEQDWMNRQPQARAGKARYRIEQYYGLKERARGRAAERDVTLDTRSSRIGSKIFEAEHISKAFGDKVILNDFSYTFARGEKVGIVGSNGVGKSTFIKMLQGIVPADNGTWNVGETVRFGYYSQDGIAFDNNKKVIDAITELAEEIDCGGDTRLAPMQWLQLRPTEIHRHTKRRRALPAPFGHRANAAPQLPDSRRAHQRPRHHDSRNPGAISRRLRRLRNGDKPRPLFPRQHRRPHIRHAWRRTYKGFPRQLYRLQSMGENTVENGRDKCIRTPKRRKTADRAQGKTHIQGTQGV